MLILWIGWLSKTVSDHLSDGIFNIIQFRVVNVFSEIPSWLHWDTLLLGVLFIVFISLGSYGLGMNIRDKRKKILEVMIRERTDDLERANEELKQRNAELDRFVYSASHDLSAPLKSILGIINVARLEKPSEAQRLYLDMMEKSVDKLELFIQEVIQYSRNARMPIRYESLSFTKMVSDILRDYQYAINFDKIHFDIEADSQEMITDSMRLKIILNNLISNGIKFHSFANHSPRIRISMNHQHDHYVIEVEDNGRGIQSEYVEKIFEMFFRATEDAPGSGLGLYILKETVTRLDGKIEVRSEVGAGTTFKITLPVPQLH